MRRPSTSRRPGTAALVLALAGIGTATGCTHNHYYGTTPAYVVPGGETVIVDDICDLPSRVIGSSPTLVARADSPASTGEPDLVTNNSRPSRVVISRPNTGPIAGVGNGWNAAGRGTRVVTTEVQGGAEQTLIR